jgi:hypothetical protein
MADGSGQQRGGRAGGAFDERLRVMPLVQRVLAKRGVGERTRAIAASRSSR